MMAVKPAKWHQIYNGNDEKRFFVGIDGKSGLIRGKDKTTGKMLIWRSIEALARESGLSKKQVEVIIKKYIELGMVVNSPKNPELWGYWENANMIKETKISMVEEDHDNRVNNQLNKIPGNAKVNTVIGGVSNSSPNQTSPPPVAATP